MAIKEMLIVTLTFVAPQMLVASAETRDIAQRSSEIDNPVTAATKQYVSRDVAPSVGLSAQPTNKNATSNFNAANTTLIAAAIAATETARIERRVSSVIYRNDGPFTRANTVKF